MLFAYTTERKRERERETHTTRSVLLLSCASQCVVFLCFRVHSTSACALSILLMYKVFDGCALHILCIPLMGHAHLHTHTTPPTHPHNTPTYTHTHTHLHTHKHTQHTYLHEKQMQNQKHVYIGGETDVQEDDTAPIRHLLQSEMK